MLADAADAHPASIRLARRLTYNGFFICYGGITVNEAVGLGGTSVVGIGEEVAVGRSVEVGTSVVTIGCDVLVAVGRFGTTVTPGVRVGTFGTQSLWPEKIVIDDPMQLARCNCGTVVP